MAVGNNERCGNCRFYMINPQDMRQGVCRSKPPVIFMVPGQGPGGLPQINFMGQWPPVRDEFWCGEWKARSPGELQ